MLLWQLFAALDVAINISYWRGVKAGRNKLEPFDIVSVPVGLLGSLGLISYAFSLPVAPPEFWLWVLPAFLAVSGWEAVKAANEREVDGFSRALGVGVVLLVAGFVSVALHRLGGSAWPTLVAT